MLLGLLMILASAGFWGINLLEERQAGRETERAAALLREQIADARMRQLAEGTEPHRGAKAGAAGANDSVSQNAPGKKEEYLAAADYLGMLSIPDLDLELPVAKQWSYPALRRTPCRYSGSLEGENLVVLAHNYERHFGGLKKLKSGAEIIFTGMDGTETHYQVMDVRTMGPDQAEEMQGGDWQMLLFTCTYGGENRVAVRCRKIEEYEK